MKRYPKSIREMQKKELHKRRRRVVAFVLISLFVLYRGIFSMILMSSNIAVTAHRGGTNVAPENTIAAVLEAAALGADCVEIDVQLNKDGQVILLHDATFKRVAGVRVRPSELTHEEIQTLNVGAYKTEAIEIHAPTLDEVIDVCLVSGLRINIELKNYPGNEELPREVVRIIKEHDFASSCVVSSYSKNFLREVKNLCPELKVGLITSSARLSTYLNCRFVDFYSVSYYALNPSIVLVAHAMHKEVHCWTPSNKFSIEYAIRSGSDNIITNNVTLTRLMIVSNH